MDVHKLSVQFAVMDKNGVILKNEKIQNAKRMIKKFISMIPKNAKYVMESSSVWYELFRMMRDDMKLDVKLSNPYQTKAIAASKKKTDKVDAAILADLLRGGYINRCHVPKAEIIK